MAQWRTVYVVIKGDQEISLERVSLELINGKERATILSSELITSGIIISIITLLVGIIVFLFTLGQKDIMTNLPVFREKSNELAHGILFLGIIMFGIVFTIQFSDSPRFSRMLFSIALIIFTVVGFRFSYMNLNLSNKAKTYTTKSKGIAYLYILFYVIAIAVAVVSILLLLNLDSPNFDTIVLHVITFLLFILSSGYFRAMSYLVNLNKVDIFYQDEEGQISKLNCYWISEIDGWIVAKHVKGEIYYLKKEKVIKMLVD